MPKTDELIRLSYAARLVGRSVPAIVQAANGDKIKTWTTACGLRLTTAKDAKHWASTVKRGRPRKVVTK